MPRRARRSVGEMIYHVFNRAAGRRKLFAADADYVAFLRVLVEALGRFPGVELFAFCIMPNHWHLVLRARRDGELSSFMRWLTQTHAQRWRRVKGSVGEGSLYQGRFKSFLVEEDRHFLVLCRYVERNALRAKLARRAEAWRWGSGAIHAGRRSAAGGDRGTDRAVGELRNMLATWPVERPGSWLALLNEPQPERDETQVRASLSYGRPLGDDAWAQRIARRLDVPLRGRGRPPGSKDRRPRRRRGAVKKTSRK